MSRDLIEEGLTICDGMVSPPLLSLSAYGLQWSSLISKSGFARENLLISEFANRAILLLEQLLTGEHYCTTLQNNLIIASSC